jgi:hypothetical protein
MKRRVNEVIVSLGPHSAHAVRALRDRLPHPLAIQDA